MWPGTNRADRFLRIALMASVASLGLLYTTGSTFLVYWIVGRITYCLSFLVIVIIRQHTNSKNEPDLICSPIKRILLGMCSGRLAESSVRILKDVILYEIQTNGYHIVDIMLLSVRSGLSNWRLSPGATCTCIIIANYYGLNPKHAIRSSIFRKSSNACLTNIKSSEQWRMKSERPLMVIYRKKMSTTLLVMYQSQPVGLPPPRRPALLRPL